MIGKDLKLIFQKIDQRLNEQRVSDFKEGSAVYPEHLTIKIIGQIALLLLLPEYKLPATNDLDAIFASSGVEKKLFLKEIESQAPNLVVDEDAALASMHPQTEYETYFEGDALTVLIAKPEYVIESKSRFKRKKDKNQLKQILEADKALKKKVLDLGADLEWLDES